MIYRGPSCLAVVWFGSSPDTPPPVRKFGRRHTGRRRKRVKLLTGEGEGGGQGAESYGRKEAWPSRNNSIFSGLYRPSICVTLIVTTSCYYYENASKVFKESVGCNRKLANRQRLAHWATTTEKVTILSLEFSYVGRRGFPYISWTKI